MTWPAKRYLVHFSVLCIFCFPTWAATLPSALDINALSAQAMRIASEFMTESSDIRLSYEYAGKFVSEDDRTKMIILATEAVNELKATRTSQEKTKRLIENYEGDDWDRRFGENLLWRKLCGDIRATQWLGANVKYHLALSLNNAQRDPIAEQIIRTCQPANDALDIERQLLRAKTFAIMSADNTDYRQIAKNEIELIFAGSLNNKNYVEAAMLKIALADEEDAKELWQGHKAMMQKKCEDDIELNIKLGLCGLRQGDKDIMASLVATSPRRRQLFGKIVLRTISQSSLQELQAKSPFEIETAVTVLRGKELEGYDTLLEKLCGIEKFRSASVLYTTAESFQGSAGAKAVEYFIASASTRQRETHASIDLSAADIALKAAVTAYQLYSGNAEHHDVAEKAIKFYLAIGPSDIDEDLEYLYASLLDEAGKNEQARAYLEKITAKNGKYARLARLELIENALKNGTAERDELLSDLLELIDLAASKQENDNVRLQAIGLYCQLRLEDGKQLGAKEVLDLLDRTATKNQMHQDLLRADALQRLGRLMEAVDVLAETLDTDRCQGDQLAAGILARIVEDADLYAGQMQNCKKLAGLCAECCQGQLKEAAELMWAEIVLVEGTGNGELAQVERIVNDPTAGNSIERMRCKARLLAAQGRFNQAGSMWNQMSHNYRPLNATAKRRPKQWWRAKFYELWCLERSDAATKGQIHHAVEVLESSFSDIPGYWAEKLSQLKQ